MATRATDEEFPRRDLQRERDVRRATFRITGLHRAPLTVYAGDDEHTARRCAIAAGGVEVLSEDVIRDCDIPYACVQQVAVRERLELERHERFGAADFPNEDAIGPMAEGGAKQIGDGHGWHRRFVAERGLRASRLEPQQIRLLEMNL